MRFRVVAVVLTCLACTAPAAEAWEEGAATRGISPQTPDDLRAGIESKHPAMYYALAKRLFEAGARDEAVFWFYVGQIRFRSYLASHPNLKPDGDPALFTALSEMVGRPLNAYAFGNIPALAAIIERALTWDAAHEDPFTPRGVARERVRAGLFALKADLVANPEKYRAQRAADGLDNRAR
ncbi:MAG TPA: hypothetical protein VFQ27_04585 [Xanthobacteraceae bacterium]|nr:hypothetical protein [Xanthobacteraceae bacterium]